MEKTGQVEAWNGAVEVMARLKNAKNQVVVVGMPPEKGLDLRAVSAGPRPRMSRADLLASLQNQFKEKLTLEACAVVFDQNGKVVSGSIIVVAAVPTEAETDGDLF